ncbi:MAG: hypothetical protein R2749_31185 [Acidimicrobiales bacterium]
MPTWHRDAVEGLELLVVEIERLDRELVPVLHELLGALPRTASPEQLDTLAEQVERLRHGLHAAERSVTGVELALRDRLAGS